MTQESKKYKISLFSNNRRDPRVKQVYSSDNFEDIHEKAKDAPWSSTIFENGHRAKKNFESADLVVLDIDDHLSVIEAKERLENLGFKYSITFSRNHQKIKHQGEASEQAACDRFRIIIPLEERVYDPGIYLQILKHAQQLFPECDRSCIDISRMYFASTGGENGVL